jgi:hypothetical protein
VDASKICDADIFFGFFFAFLRSSQEYGMKKNKIGREQKNKKNGGG